MDNAPPLNKRQRRTAVTNSGADQNILEYPSYGFRGEKAEEIRISSDTEKYNKATKQTWLPGHESLILMMMIKEGGGVYD